MHAVDVTAKLRGGDSTEVAFSPIQDLFALSQNTFKRNHFKDRLQVFQLIIKSQPVNEDTRKFLQPNRTFEKEVCSFGERSPEKRRRETID